MSELLHPRTHHPVEFVATLRGHVCLRLDCTVTPAVEWFKLADVSPHLTDMVYTCQEPPRAIVVYLSPAMAAAVSHSAGVQIVVRKPAPVITLWHGSMKEAA